MKALGLTIFFAISVVFLSAQDKAKDNKTVSKGSGYFEENGKSYATFQTGFSLSSSDSLSLVKKVEFSIDGRQFTSYSQPFSFSSEGEHSIVYRAIDKAGNRERNQHLNVVIDNSPPKIKTYFSVKPVFSNLNQFVPKNVKLILSASDEYSGVNKIEYSINSGQKTEYKKALSFSVHGKIILDFNASDRLGNTTMKKKIAFFVDAKGPKIDWHTRDNLVSIDGKMYCKKNNLLILDIQDVDSGVAKIEVYHNNSKSALIYQEPILLNQAGVNNYKIVAYDRAGNQNELKNLTIIVDPKSPSSKLRY